MNPRLGLLQPYPFERLRTLLAGSNPPAGLAPISLGLGEPQHPTPAVIKDALAAEHGRGSRAIRSRWGCPELRAAMAEWLARRHGLERSMPRRRSSRSPAAARRSSRSPRRSSIPPSPTRSWSRPNPFYQIYEGAALLGGAQPYYVNSLARNGMRVEWHSVPDTVWKRVRLLYACSPSNPARPRHVARGMEAALRALRPPRLRDRLRRVLQRGLLRRVEAAARRARRGEAARPRGLAAADRDGIAVEALERARGCAPATPPATARS
jgi:hypothetical protein